MPDPLIGVLLDGRYRVERALSEGGMGVVYRGVDERMRRPVAIKVIVPELAEDPTFAERMRREATIAGSLAHAHVVQTTDWGTSPGGGPYVVMELLDGEPLSALLRRNNRLPAERLLPMVDQMLDALAAAHGAGVVHRDLKPANVFVTRHAGGTDSIKLLDFGVAKLMDSDAYRRLTATGQLLGTPTWMAPEQARGEVVDARADVYAVGLIAYRALAGRLPWEADSRAALLVAIQDVAPEPLTALVPDLDPGLDAIVRMAIAKRPADRFSTANEMRSALRRSLPSADDPTRPMPDDPPVSALATTAPATAPTVPERPRAVAHDPPSSGPDTRRELGKAATVVGLALGALAVIAIGILAMSYWMVRASVDDAPPSPTECLVVPGVSALNGVYPHHRAALQGMDASEPSIVACLSHVHEPALPGEFDVGGQLTVSASGGVDAAQLSDLGPVHEADRACLEQALRGMQLDPPATPGTMQLTLTFLCR